MKIEYNFDEYESFQICEIGFIGVDSLPIELLRMLNNIYTLLFGLVLTTYFHE